MSSNTIFDPDRLSQEISDSHKRSAKYGIDPRMTRNPAQVHLTPEGLSMRREKNRKFLDVVMSQMREIYSLVSGAGFAMIVTDYGGYILDIIGDDAIIEKFAERNCIPGYRWTEKDVGTSAISLSLERRIPVQINDSEHYCKRGHGYTSSSAPIFDAEKKLAGAIAMSGKADHVHLHTLGMVITAARAIENQLRLIKKSEELLIRNSYMNAIIESIDSGVMAVDTNGIIAQINSPGKAIIRWEEGLEGRPLDDVTGFPSDWKRIIRDRAEYTDREFILRRPRAIHLIYTAKPICDSDGNVKGIIIVFNEISRIRRLVNEMAGSHALFTFEDIIGISPTIEETRKLAMIAAMGRSAVLLLGETGTGKELFAQAIHNQSDRSGRPFVAINCGAIPRELVESELFGYARGAFTGARKGGRTGKFELASGGTVFLDEIGDMPGDMQVKLLRVLQTGEVCRIGDHSPITPDVRIIAATNADLKKEVSNRNFREDLFYRLNVFPISIPPLRERHEDIVPLARHILNRCSQALNKPDLKLSPESEHVLASCYWSGNVRELENIVERAANLSGGEKVGPELLGITATKKKFVLTERKGTLLEDAERQIISETLEAMNFNLSGAAKALGITRATLYKKIRKYHLSVQRETL
ncbi:MAG: PAS domain-containing protein [Desulfobacterales bacterium]|nr:PAS domain-containing protein [Desulfobacterales bacterium]